MSDRPRRTHSQLAGADPWQMEMALTQSRRTERDEEARRKRHERAERQQREEEEQRKAAMAKAASQATAQKKEASLLGQTVGRKRKVCGELGRLTYSWLIAGPADTDAQLKSHMSVTIERSLT